VEPVDVFSWVNPLENACLLTCFGSGSWTRMPSMGIVSLSLPYLGQHQLLRGRWNRGREFPAIDPQFARKSLISY